MRVRLCVSLFLLAACAACSSNSAKKTVQPPTSTGTDTGTETETNTSTDAGDSDAGTTENCPEWPKEKLMPMIGPFFFGNLPRPCRVKNVLNGTSQYYEYQGDHVATLTAVAANDQTTFQYEGDLIVGAARTQPSGSSTQTYDYTAERLTQTAESDGTTSKTVYRLDARGYPTVATVEPPQEGQPARFVHVYKDCRLVQRIAYDADGSVNNDISAEYYYDDDTGRITERYAPKDDQLFGYLNDSGDCVMP